MSAELQKGIKLNKELRFEDVEWNIVQNLLQRRFKCSAHDTERDIKSFFKRYLRPFNTYWYLQSTLTLADNRLLAAICECNGADSVQITHDKIFRVAGVPIEYHQEVSFEPTLRKGSETATKGKCKAFIEVAVFGVKLNLSSLPGIVCFHAALFILAIISYLVIAAFLIYGFAVIRMFASQPLGEFWLAVMKNDSLVLALICFLIGLAGIFGKSIIYVARLSMRSFSAIFHIKTKLKMIGRKIRPVS